MQGEFIPVVVVGAGPTGLAAANLLGKAGIATLVIERRAGVSDIPTYLWKAAYPLSSDKKSI